jgi:hypothetical protein
VRRDEGDTLTLTNYQETGENNGNTVYTLYDDNEQTNAIAQLEVAVA